MTAPVEDGKEAMHVVRSGSFHLPVAPVRAFPSFSPEGERAWAPGWAPEYLYPPDGAPSPGLGFRTAATGERTAGAFAAMLEQWQKAIVKTLVSDAA